jgi:hypothetical protein
MANQVEPIPSARVKPFLVPPTGGGDPIPLGLVEDISFPDSFMPENFRTIGESHPPDNVLNFVEGRVRFTKVWQSSDVVLDTLRPRIAEFTAFKSFGLLILDPVDNKVLAFAIGCLPEQLEFTDRGGSAPRLNFSGVARYILFAGETAAALAAAA